MCFSLARVNAQKPGAYKCLDFDGSNDYVVMKDHADLNSDSTITVEAWINADSYGSNSWTNSIFCKHGWGRGNQGYVLRCGDNGKLSFNFADANNNWREAISSSLMKTGVWYHVAGTYDGDTISLYINGKLVETTLLKTSISPSTGLTCRIGDLAYGGGRLFDGKIDDVRVWSTALDEETIRDWMCRRVNKNHPNYKNLAGYWKLDEDSGTSANDDSGNGLTGTLTNGPTITNSGATIGDLSAHTYGGTSVSLTTKFGDVMDISDITRSPDCFHVVVDYTRSGQGLANKDAGDLDSSHYFSIFHPNDTLITYSVSYDFGNRNDLSTTGKCGLDLYKKTSGQSGNWTVAGATFHAKGDSLTLKNQKRQEIATLIIQTDSNKVLSTRNGKFTICGNDSLELIAVGNDSFSYVWYRNGKVLSGKNTRSIFVDSVAKYRVQVTRNGTSCTFSSSTVSVDRQAFPTVTMNSFAGVCEDVDTVRLLSANPSPSGGVFSGTGVKDSFFFPSKVKQGTYTITYTYTDTTLCFSTAKQDIQVFGLPSLNKVASLEFCSDKDSVQLAAYSPKGGTYAGNYFSNGYFHIDSAQRVAKFYTFTYSFTDGNGCSSSIGDSLEVKWATPCTFSPVSQLCVNDDPVTLKGVPASGVFSGKGVTGSSFNPGSAGVGKHRLVYAFTNLLNCTTTDTQVVTVIDKSKVTWNQKINRCLNGDTLQLSSGTPSGGYFEGPGTSKSGVFDPSVAGSGTHGVSYVYIDGNGCHNKETVAAVVYDTTEITFSNIPQLCPYGDAEALSFAMPAGGNYSGKGITSDTMYPNLAGVGFHQVTYSYTNTNNCVSSGLANVEVLKPDSISVSTQSPLCTTNDPVQIKLYPAGGSLKGKGIIGSVFSPAIGGEGTHVLVYSKTGSNGCLSVDSFPVNVSKTPSVTFDDLLGICQNGDPIVLNTALPPGGEYSINGSLVTSLDPGTLTTGVHMIQYKASNGICADSLSASVRIHPVPARPLISLKKNTLVSTASDNYQWHDEQGPISGATNREFDPTTDGGYWVVVTSDSGCSAQSDTFDFMYVAVSDILPDWLHIYPNPSNSGVFNISTTKSLQILGLKDIHGREVAYTHRMNPSALDLSSYPDGVYILQLQIGSDHYNVRLIKN